MKLKRGNKQKLLTKWNQILENKEDIQIQPYKNYSSLSKVLYHWYEDDDTS